MEDILAKIMKDASSAKHSAVKQSCLESQEFLANQHSLMRSPPYELRQKCLDTFKLALETKQGKLVSHALSGFQRMIWDKGFQSVFESGIEENWFPVQLLRAVSSIHMHSDDVQVEILKILLNMTSTHGQSLTSSSIITLITLCVDSYSSGSAAVKTAAQATVNQTLTSFCIMLQENSASQEEESDDSEEESYNVLDSIIEELYPVLHFTCEKLKSNNSLQKKAGAPLLLQCILSVLKNIKIEIHQNMTLLNFVWQELCPLLIAFLGSPKTDKNIISSQKSSEGNEIGRGSGCLAAAPSCNSMEAKSIYSIAVELVRLVGSVGSLRPVLESLFHRMLLYPSVQHRLEALKAVKELFSKPELLLELASPPLHSTSDKDWISLDLDLIKIPIDALGECCHSSDKAICYASVSCVLELLRSLEEICDGKKMKEEVFACINTQFRTLESSDYKGAKSERWLKTKLRSLILEKEKQELLKKNKNDTSESTEDLSQHSVDEAILDEHENETTPVETAINAADKEVNEKENKEPLDKTVSVDPEIEDESIIKDIANYVKDDDDDDENDSIKNGYQSVPAEDSGDDQNENSENASENKLSPINLDLQLSNQSDDSLTVPEKKEDIVSPQTESAEDALNYASSNSSEGLSEDFLECGNENEDEISDNIERLKKIPKTLLGKEDAGKEERERVEKLCLARFEFAQQERQNARRFVEILQSFLSELLAIRSSIEADQALQEFASKYCESLWQAQQNINESNSETENVKSHITILNADGIYLALYSALLLNLKLIRTNYYKDSASPIPLTEQQFIEEVHGSGVLVYLSATWLAELYQQVLAINLLEQAGYKPVSHENYALVNLLSGLLFGTDDWWNKNISDVDGLGNTLPGAQQLADYRRLERAIVNTYNSPNVEAGRKFSRRILTCCWETVLEVLSVLLNGTNSCGISSTIGFLLGTEGAKEEHRKTKDAIAESLDGLQRAAKLCNTLGLQASCSAVFAQLAIASCPLSEDQLFPQSSINEYRQHFKRSFLPGRSKNLRLHESHILSMDVILSRGLELGSHSPNCWRYVFQCCLFVLQLENTYFSGHGNIQSMLSRPALSSLNSSENYETSMMYEASSNDYSELSSMPGSSLPQKFDVTEIIKKNKGFTHSSGVVKDQQLLEAIEALSQQVDRLFEEAASRLNLSALISFLVELCAASQIQLFTQNFAKFSSSSIHGSNLLLYHLGDVMLRCARGGRPLIHVMRAWSVVAPHFVEAACHKDSLISKKGVTTIHDIVNALLSTSSELPHFHFNEALFKPFENLLCLELCDTDIQEQIVSSICEFVEGCTTEIRSGWRPLFGALRAVRIPSTASDLIEPGLDKEHYHHLRVVLDVFEAFLGTDNMFVFAYAAVDCLLCLLKHVKGPGDMQDSPPDFHIEKFNSHGIPLDMCLAALKYLEKCSAILSSMFTIPTCPVFHSANRIQLYSEPSLVDPYIPGLQLVYFEDPNSLLSKENVEINEDQEINSSKVITDIPVTLSSLDNHTGIIHVWFLLIEGLAGCLATCPKRYQSHTMESLFNMLQSLKDVPGPEFGIYCVNHLLLPMLQIWLRRTTKIYRGWENFATNFKQCCGLATDLIVDYIQHIAGISPQKLSSESGVHLMIQQLFLILTECVAQPMEIISRLGCACIRHTVMSAGKYFTSHIWDTVCLSLQRACQVSLYSVKQLMMCFHADSDNFYGDIGEVKVAARRDVTVQESERLRQLAHQVFLLDSQQACNNIIKSTCVEDDERSFTFLLFPPDQNPEDSDASIIRVPFCSLVVGLLSHQILLQTIGTMLLQGTKYMLPTLMTFLPSESNSLLLQPSTKPGFLSLLSINQLIVLLKTLEDSYETACSFDLRPGLKFLVQKVAQTNVAANLYKQAGVSWTIHMVVLFELSISQSPVTLDFVKNEVYSKEAASTLSNGQDNTEEPESPSDKTNGENHSSLHSDCSDFNEFILLKEKFRDIAETYTEHCIDKDGLTSIVDKMSDQPIFFLATPIDEVSDFISPVNQSESNNSKNDLSEINYDSSDSEDLTNGRGEDAKDKIYTLATEHTINSLISEYKKRKNQHSMPSRLKEKLSRKTSSGSRRKDSSGSSIPEEIVIQRRNSIMKDGEAHLQVFKQLIQSFLDLHQSLNDELFQAFLPVFFPGVQFLVAYSSDGELRLSISEWLQRLAVCCKIYPNLRTE